MEMKIIAVHISYRHRLPASNRSLLAPPVAQTDSRYLHQGAQQSDGLETSTVQTSSATTLEYAPSQVTGGMAEIPGRKTTPNSTRLHLHSGTPGAQVRDERDFQHALIDHRRHANSLGLTDAKGEGSTVLSSV